MTKRTQNNKDHRRRNDFNKTAKSTSVVFDYEAEVRDFYQSYPDYKDKLFFFDGSAEKLVYPATDTARQKAEDILLSNPDVRAALRRTQKRGLSRACNYPDAGYRCIMMSTAKRRHSLPSIFGSKDRRAREMIYVLDHEIGHSICEGGIGEPRNRAECIADTFAVVRQLQRFGNKTPGLETLLSVRAIELVFRDDDGNHFTAPVLEKVLEQRDRIDFGMLSPEETVDMTTRLVRQHRPPQERIKQLSEHFSAFKKRFPELASGAKGIVHDLVNTVLETQDPMAFHWGHRALNAFMDGKVYCRGKKVLLSAQDTKDLPDKLAEKQMFLRQMSATSFKTLDKGLTH